MRQLRPLWEHYNRLHFEGKLQPVPIRRTRSRRTFGYFEGATKGRSPRIAISVVQADTEQLVNDTLLHEMIHQFLYETGVANYHEHGAEFQAKHRRLFGEVYAEPARTEP